MPLYLGNSLIGSVYVGTVPTGVTNITLPSPSISVNSSTGLITATVTNSTAGYLQTGSTSATSQLTTQGATTITPNSTSQTAAAAGKYLLGNITVSAVPTETKTISANGTYTPSSGKYFSSVTVSISGGGGGLDTSDATAVAGDILLNKTAYVNGVKVTGSMPNNGALSSTITSQNGTYTIPAGYTSGGTVTASLTATTLTNSIISGSAYAEATGDYAWRSTVQIPAGYHNATTLTKDFSSIFPAPDTPATASQILLNYQAYDKDGKLVTGTMTNNSIGTITLDQTTTSYTIPAGYHDGTGKVQHTTVNIPDPTITVSSSGLITASGSWTRGFTTDNSYSKTKQLTTKAATTYTPGTTNQTIASGTYLTGIQTISGDADLVASNIISTANIFGVQGSVVINKFYTGSSAPSSSLGDNGDIYLQS